MDTASRKNLLPRTATNEGTVGAPDQGSLFEPPRPTWRSWIRWLIRGDYKPLGLRCFGGDPEQARIAMLKVLEAKQGRRFDIEWLDLVAEQLGADGEEAIARFVCDRYGFQPPVRKPDPQREEEQLHHVERALTSIEGAVGDLKSEVERLRKVREAGK